MRRALVLFALFGACKSAPAPTPVTPANEAPRVEAAPAEPASAPVPEPAPAPPPLSDAELDQRRSDVNRLYDQQDFEAAIAGAEAILAQRPDDVRMLRVATSAHCILGDADKARAHWARLPEHDKEQIAKRCARYGITLP